MKTILLHTIRGCGKFICMPVLGLVILSSSLKCENQVDSLTILLEKLEGDTTKIEILLKLQEAHKLSDFKNSISFGRAGLELAEQLNYLSGELKASIGLGIVYKKMGVFDSSLYYTGKAIKIAELVEDKIQQTKNYNLYGSLLRRKGYHSSALDYHQKSLLLSEQINYNKGIANAYVYLAIIHEYKMNYDTAINYYYKSLRMYEESDNKLNIGIALLNIGDMYENLREYDKSLINYKKGLSLFEDQKDIVNIGLSNNKIGIIYSQTGKYDSAMIYYKVCESNYINANNVSGLAHLAINKGNVYMKWQEYDSAYYYFNKAESSFEQMDYKRGYLNALLAKSTYYTKTGQKDKALDIYEKCEEIAAHIDPQALRDVYSNILEIYKDSDNYKKAFEYQTKYYEINDSIFQLEKATTIADIELIYEKEKDQAKILQLENENLAMDLNLRKKTNQRNIYLFCGIGIVVIILFLFIFYRQKAIKDHVIANQRIKQLEEEKKLLAAKFLVEGQEEERKRIAKELHDGLGVLLSTTKMQFTSIKDKSPKNVEIIDKATKLLEQATGDVRKISHNMMPGLLTRFGLYEAAEDLIEQLDETEGLNATCTISGDTKRLQENKEIMLYRIIQEMVNNTLKHAEAKTITMNINIHSNQINIGYSDDGKGFNVEEKFQSKSIGLNSIQSRINFLGGELTIQSEKGKGVNYTIQVPIN